MSKQAVLRLLAQLTFGTDTLIGLGTYVILSFLFWEKANLWFLLLAGFFAYLPDLDLTWFVFQSKEVRRLGHWRLGLHHPMILLPVSVGIVWWLSSPYLVAIAFVCIFGHFVHDGWQNGMHWVSPFTRGGKISFEASRWARWRISHKGIELLSQKEVEDIYAQISRKSAMGGSGKEIATRVEAVSALHVCLWLLFVSGLAALAVCIGYRLPF